MIDLEQDAIDLSLEHIKAQHTRLRWLHVKYLLGQYCMWTTFGKSNFFGRFLKSSWYSLSRMLWIFRWSIPRHNILEFGGRMCNICSDSLLCGQLLGNQISFCDCRTGHEVMTALEQDAIDLSLEHTKLQHTRIWLLNVKYLLGQCFMWKTLGLLKISLGDFWIFHNTLEHKTVGLSLEYVKAPHNWIWCLGFAF